MTKTVSGVLLEQSGLPVGLQRFFRLKHQFFVRLTG